MPSLSEDERSEILRVAREAIEEAVLRGQMLRPHPVTEILKRHCGVFVTLHAHRQLRGCIGVLGTQEPLERSLVRAASNAALEDPRFKRVRPEELENLRIEVSLLSDMQMVRRVEEIEAGRDGLLVERGALRGLLLPQVANEQHLDRIGFLQETCHKAGLPRDAWKDPATTIHRFQCEIIDEQRLAS